MSFQFLKSIIILFIVILALLLYSCQNKPLLNNEIIQQEAEDSLLSKALQNGQFLFDQKCDMCHNKADSINALTGPALIGITNEVSKEWFLAYTKDSWKMLDDGDPRAVCAWENWQPSTMLPYKDSLSDTQITDIYDYLAKVTMDKKLPYGWPCDYSTRAMVSEDSIISLKADIKRDHRIFGYMKPDTTSEKLLLLSIFTSDVVNNPYNCKLGAYYETNDMTGLQLKYLGMNGQFIKAAAFAKKSRQSTIFYFQRKSILFDHHKRKMIEVK